MSGYQRRWLALVAVSGFLAVALGAFAAHGLKPYLDERSQEWFKLATTYQMWHTLALLGLAATWLEKNKGFRFAAWGWLVGMLLFSGSLYLMASTGDTRLAIITPIGGLVLLLGWLSLFVGVVRGRIS